MQRLRNLAVIPIRMGSKRLPRKNVRSFFGKPIFAYSLQYARETRLFDEIFVSTESKEVAELCKEYGLNLPFLRPEELANDSCQLVDVLEHVLDEFQSRGRMFDNVCLLWATAPMRLATDISGAYEMLRDDPETEAVVGVTDFELPVFCALTSDSGGYLSPLFPEFQKRSSALQPRVVVDNSSMCWFKVSAFRQQRTWMPEKLKGFWMNPSVSVDIEDEGDWQLAEFRFRRLFAQKNH